MWYMPYVRVRRAALVYALFAVAISLVAIALRFWPGALRLDSAQVERVATVRIDLAMLFAGSAALVGGFATVLGLNLAAENEGHLELAWTKPVSREGYALGVFAVDLAAMAACIVLTVICAAIVTDVYLGHQAVEVGGGRGFVDALAFCGFPLCVYAWITALSASLKRNRGTVAGLFWPLMIAVAALGLIPVPIIHAVATAVNTFNPIEIYTIHSNGSQSAVWRYFSGWAIAAVLLIVALVQWRRLEA